MDIRNFKGITQSKQVPNPLYNPNAKRNKAPKFVTETNLGPVHDNIVDIAVMDKERQLTVDSDYAAKYNKAGINWNPYEDLDSQLADSQSIWSKTFNALGQTLVSEIGIGTIKGFSDMFDYVASNIFGAGEANYSNPVSETLAEWQEKFNTEVAPIYTKPDVNIDTGGLSDASWWLSNIPQIASSLTLLIPARATTAGISKLGSLASKGIKTATAGTKAAEKAAKLSAKTQRWINNVDKIEAGKELNYFERATNAALNDPIIAARVKEGVKNSADALLMRTMENYQESHDVYKDTYENEGNTLIAMQQDKYDAWLDKNKGLKQKLQDAGIDLNDRDEVAKYIARKAADRTFAMDFGNVVFDVMQLYGLGNIGKGVKKAKGFRVNSAQRQSIAEAQEVAGTVVDDAAKAANTVSKSTKFKNLLGDAFKGYGLTALEESTEGIEEAINFIAQQEGLTYGKALVSGDTDDNVSTLVGQAYEGFKNAAIEDYMKDPQLHESAFWGWLGGMVFGVGGTELNRAQLYFKAKADKKAREVNPITGEKVEDNTDWIDMLEMSDTKAAVMAINKRAHRLQELKEKLSSIKDNFDIYGNRKEDGTYEQFSGDTELQQALARERAINEYVSDIAMDAMNSGTFDMLVEYLQSDVVKKALGDIGIGTEEGTDNRVKNIVSRLYETRNVYSSQAANIRAMLRVVNAEHMFGEKAPVEAIQHLAMEDTRRILQNRQYKEQIAATEKLIASLENEARENSDRSEEQNVEDRATVKYAMLVDMHGRLQAEINELEKESDDKVDKWEKAMQLKTLKRQQKELERQIALIPELSTREAVSEVLNRLSSRYRKAVVDVTTPDGRTKKETKYYLDNEIEETDDEIVARLEKEFAKTDKENASTKATVVKQAAKVLEDRINTMMSSKEESVRTTNPRLFDAYAKLSELGIKQAFNMSMLNNTTEAVRDSLDLWNNRHNKARQELLTKAEDVVIKIFNKYQGARENVAEDLRNIILGTYVNDKAGARQLASEIFNANDADDLLSAIDIFHFSGAANENLWQYFDTLFKREAERIARENLKKRVESSTSENSAETAQPTEQDSKSQTVSESGSEAENVQNGVIINTKTDEQTKSQNANGRKEVSIKIVFNNNNEIVDIRRANKDTGLTGYLNEDGSIEIDVKSLNKNAQFKYIFSELFDSDEGDILDENVTWEIERNPVIGKFKKSYKLKNKGYIKITDNRRPEESEIDTATPVEDTATPQSTKYNVGDVLDSPYGKVEIVDIEEDYYGWQQVNGEESGYDEISSIDKNADWKKATTSESSTEEVEPEEESPTEEEKKEEKKEEKEISKAIDDTIKSPVEEDNPKDSLTGVGERTYIVSPIEVDLNDNAINASKFISNSEGIYIPVDLPANTGWLSKDGRIIWSSGTTVDVDRSVNSNGVYGIGSGGNIEFIDIDDVKQIVHRDDPSHTTKFLEAFNKQISDKKPTTTNKESLLTNNNSVVLTEKDEDDEVIPFYQRLNIEIRKRYIPDISADLDFDAIERKAINEISIEGIEGATEEQKVENIKKILAMYKQANESIKNLNPLDKSAAVLAFASRHEELAEEDKDGKLAFLNAMEHFMREYEKLVIVPEVNGKRVVKLRDVLRLCSQIYGNNTEASRAMYTVLSNYLLSTEGQARYLLLDVEDTVSGKVLDDLNKSRDELNDELLSEYVETRVMTKESLSLAVMNNDTEFIEAFDNIKTGDTLQVSVDYGSGTNGNLSFIYEKDGKKYVIGRTPIPKVINGRYVEYNSGWRHDVTLNEYGEPVSGLKELLFDLFTGDTQDHKELQQILTEYMALSIASDNQYAPNPYGNRSNLSNNRTRLLHAFASNKLIKDIIQNAINAPTGENIVYIDYKTKAPDIDNMLNMLSKIWGYSLRTVDGNTRQENINGISASLNNWFIKLYDSYEAVSNITKSTTVTVAKMNEGSIIQATQTRGLQAYFECPTVAEGLSKKYEARISIVDNENGNVVHVSGRANHYAQKSLSRNSSVISVYSRNEEPDFVNIFGIALLDEQYSKGNTEFGRILSSTADYLTEVIDDYIKSPSPVTKEKLFDALTSIFRCDASTGKIPLLSAIRGRLTIKEGKFTGEKASGDAIEIQYYDPNNSQAPNVYFRIYAKSDRSSFGYGIVVGNNKLFRNVNKDNKDTFARELVEALLYQKEDSPRQKIVPFMKNILQVNIDRNGIELDNVPNKQVSGFITRQNGKLVINIPSRTNPYLIEHDSYNDYLINSNLLRVNTKINKNGSNFERIGKKQQENQNLLVNLPKPKRRVTSASSGSQIHIEENTDENTFKRIESIFEFGNIVSGTDLVAAVFSDEAIDRLNQIRDELGIVDDIFATNIFYDGTLNYDTNGKKVHGIQAYSRGNRKEAFYNAVRDGKKVRQRMPKAANTVIGPLLINMMASNNVARRNRAFRVLIHERLHEILQSDEAAYRRAIDSIKPIYDEFKENLDRDLSTTDKTSRKYRELEDIKNALLGYTGDRLLEEFIVEAVTRKTLFDYLNNIKSKNNVTSTTESLFSKIAKLIAKFFNWDIHDDSLYMEALQTINNMFAENVDIESEEESKVEPEEEKIASEETTPVEDNSNQNEDTDYDFDAIDEEDDDGSEGFASQEEELDEEPIKPNSIVSLEGFRNTLSDDVQIKFDNLIENGWISIRC